ncbi:MAG: hypothetical protein WC998_09765 [Candidatus Paceibacterota bacterium]|jgi:hypothetical protein
MTKIKPIKQAKMLGLIGAQCARDLNVTESAVSLVLNLKSTSKRIKGWYVVRGVNFD